MIAKFPKREEDDYRPVTWESVALQLAREAGLQVTESRIESVTGNDEHVVKRFDRRGTVIGVRRTTAEHDLASKS